MGFLGLPASSNEYTLGWTTSPVNRSRIYVCLFGGSGVDSSTRCSCSLTFLPYSFWRIMSFSIWGVG